MTQRNHVNQSDLNESGSVVPALCIHVQNSAEQIKPLSARQYRRLVDRVPDALPLVALFEMTHNQIHDLTGLPPLFCHHVSELLKRRNIINTELARIRSLGITLITIESDIYPDCLKLRLGELAPPALFIAGNPSLLTNPGIAVTGMRDLDAKGESFARLIGSMCAAEEQTVFSGLARGADKIAMIEAMHNDGKAVGIVPARLDAAMNVKTNQTLIQQGALTLATPYHPLMRFTAGKAKGRNKIIYALSSMSISIAAKSGTGGAWTGALDAIRLHDHTVFVRSELSAPPGNAALLACGALPVNPRKLKENGSLTAYLKEIRDAAPKSVPGEIVQLELPG